MHGLHVEGYCRSLRWRLTTRCHGYNISAKSNEAQDTSSRVKIDNPKCIHLVGRIESITKAYLL